MAGELAPRVAIVGAGAGGVALASALVAPGRSCEVVLIDPGPGRSPAFSPPDESLLLNTPADVMSIDPGSPDGFVNWLNTYRNRPRRWAGDDFVPRRLFGDYLADRLRNLEARPPTSLRAWNAPGRIRPSPSISTAPFTSRVCSSRAVLG